jgi:hypothetical protein
MSHDSRISTFFAVRGRVSTGARSFTGPAPSPALMLTQPYIFRNLTAGPFIASGQTPYSFPGRDSRKSIGDASTAPPR